MATIALYAGKMNQVPGLVSGIKKSVTDYKSELSAMRTKALQINQSICDLSSVIDSIQAASQTQEEKEESLDLLNQSLEQFTVEAVRVDDEVADLVRQQKDNFYEQYNYLKPVSEMNGWERYLHCCMKANEWCREHLAELVITFVIVIGAVLAIVAVICSGGLALVPILSAGLTALGVSAGTAFSVATVISLSVASIALISTIISTTMNIIDIWCDMSNNSTFESWRTAINWVSAISNGFYSIGAFYNSRHGITNESLRKLAKMLRGDNEFLLQIVTSPNTSAFWSGFGSGGATVAEDMARTAGKETLEITVKKLGVSLPDYDPTDKAVIEIWNNASSAFAWNSSGNVTVFLGQNVGLRSVWRRFEYPLLQMNPNVKNIVVGSGHLLTYFTSTPFYSGLESIIEAIINLIANQQGEE